MVYIIVYYIQDYNHSIIVWVLHSLSIGPSEGDGFIDPLPFMRDNFFCQPTDDGVNISYNGMISQLLHPLWF